MMRSPQRYTRVAWLAQSDLEAMGEPETSVIIGHDDRTDGWLIPHPFGHDTDAVLSVHATRGNGNDGGRITLAIGTVIQVTKTPTGRTYQPYLDGAQQGRDKNRRSQDGPLENDCNDPDGD